MQTSILSYKNTTRSKVHFQVTDDGDKSKDPMEPPQSKIAKTDAGTIDLTDKSDSISKNLWSPAGRPGLEDASGTFWKKGPSQASQL